jgi:hypothetical protein
MEQTERVAKRVLGRPKAWSLVLELPELLGIRRSWWCWWRISSCSAAATAKAGESQAGPAVRVNKHDVTGRKVELEECRVD